jgi:methylated-DNA-[protein]-cysteine S-methyltransferase
MKSTEAAEEHLHFPYNELERNSKHIKNEVYNILLKIPAGKVSTYGDIAKALGYPKAARLIGQILHDNPNPVIVPCHRVIHSDGRLGGYAYGTERKRELLEKEGIRFRNANEGYVEEFQKCRIEFVLVTSITNVGNASNKTVPALSTFPMTEYR